MLNRYIANIALSMLPVSRFYAFKRWLAGRAGMDVAPGVRINGHTWFYGPGQVSMGRNTWVGPRCRFYTVRSTRIAIGMNCDIGPEVCFMAGTHLTGTSSRRAGEEQCRDIMIGNGCWIGMGTTLLAGVTIGPGTVIGAGALVNRDIPADSLAVGVPARVIKKLDV